ncbi:MAG: EthD family reductase [Aquihabitans sp.]
MIRFSVFYPATEGSHFDHDYYRDSHVPLCVKTWGVERYEIDKGVNGPFTAAVHFFFDSLDAMNSALAVDGTAAVQADVANYTDITPQRQVAEVV